MIVETYLEGKFIKEREIDLTIFYDRLNNYIADNKCSYVKVVTISPVNKGVSFTFNNVISMSDFNLHEFNGSLIIEFELFKNAITLNNEANVCLDLSNKRVIFRDFGITLNFY